MKFEISFKATSLAELKRDLR
jgi:hypothetical protein